MKGYTYLLECSDGTYYAGSTNNLERRIVQHNEGTGAKYTASRVPVVVVWAGEFAHVAEAFWFEKQIQGWSRAKREALIEGRYCDLPELAQAYVHRARVVAGGAPLETQAPDSAH